jgi:hypothetical protein
MDKQTRREAIRDYKERKATPGVFAVRCLATGEVWVAPSRNMAQQQNGVWFGLRLGSHRNKALQALWNRDGEAGIAFEPLELFEDEEASAYMVQTWLKAAERRWLETLGAKKLFG